MNYSQQILKEIQEYETHNISEKQSKKKIINFILNNPENTGRENPAGHLTASAWIINLERNKVLLHHHLSLNKWIQLGGHLEKDELIKEAALREAAEESGLNSLSFVNQKIFDLDVHKIPAADDKVGHFHYDLRYLLEADGSEKLVKSQESINLKWIDLDKVNNYLNEESILRMVRKTRLDFG